MSDIGNPPPDPQEPGGSQPAPPPPPFGQQPVGQPPPAPPGGVPAPPPYGQPGGYQQPGGYGQPAGARPDNYLVWAILSTLFCCLPLGVVSIVFAAQVNGKYQSGDYAGAVDASNKAKQFAMWSAIIGAIVIVIYAIAVAGSSDT